MLANGCSWAKICVKLNNNKLFLNSTTPAKFTFEKVYGGQVVEQKYKDYLLYKLTRCINKHKRKTKADHKILMEVYRLNPERYNNEIKKP